MNNLKYIFIIFVSVVITLLFLELTTHWKNQDRLTEQRNQIEARLMMNEVCGKGNANYNFDKDELNCDSIVD